MAAERPGTQRLAERCDRGDQGGVEAVGTRRVSPWTIIFADDSVMCSESWIKVEGGHDRHKWHREIVGGWDKDGGKSQVFRVKCLLQWKGRMEQGEESVGCALQ